MTKPTSVLLRAEQLQRLAELQAQTGLTQSELLRRAVDLLVASSPELIARLASDPPGDEETALLHAAAQLTEAARLVQRAQGMSVRRQHGDGLTKKTG